MHRSRRVQPCTVREGSSHALFLKGPAMHCSQRVQPCCTVHEGSSHAPFAKGPAMHRSQRVQTCTICEWSSHAPFAKGPAMHHPRMVQPATDNSLFFHSIAYEEHDVLVLHKQMKDSRIKRLVLISHDGLRSESTCSWP